MTMLHAPSSSDDHNLLLDRTIDDLLLRLRGLVLVRGCWNSGAPRPPSSRPTLARPSEYAPRSLG
jgi:hypothetical protein